MNNDKNTIIGFVLLAGLFFAYFWYTNKQQNEYNAYKKRFDDSVAALTKKTSLSKDTSSAVALASVAKDSTGKIDTVKESISVLENDMVKVYLSNKGGQIQKVSLKHYVNAEKKNVTLGDSTSLTYPLNLGNNQTAQVNQLLFQHVDSSSTNGTQKLTYTYSTPNGGTIQHIFTLQQGQYNVDWTININGADQVLTNHQINVLWEAHSYVHERSLKYERQMSNVCFSEGKEFDYISSKTTKTFEKPIQWVVLVQQFFNTTLVAKDGFASGKLDWSRRADSSNALAYLQSQFQTTVNGNNVSVPLSIYYGPNDLNVLKSQAPEMEKIVNLGRDLYSFVRPINRYVIKPVFDFFGGMVTNLGWAVLLLTIFIRLITAPLTYSSYLSSAKMKVLKPELDGIKAKLGDNQQAFAMEQMKLFREAGVNPLGGCIPSLLQIPIFFALYSFFNSNISLRGQAFLWSKDLSSYDSILNLPFDLPLGIGNHISLFTLIAVVTMFIMSMYNMSMTPATQDNPAMKYMPYIFPVMMFFMFNSLPSALTWYYSVSNIITLVLQLIIQKFIINHDKILAEIEVKRKTPKKKSNWQSKYEDMVNAQKKVQELKEKTKK
jgi:YidC/Oxa1 family membrane protein insertase